MDLFTVKDFINYGNPCINCGKVMRIFVEQIFNDECSKLDFNYDINSHLIKIIVQTKYKSSLKLNINLLNNKYYTNDNSWLKQFLTNKQIGLSSWCDYCESSIVAAPLSFNKNKFIDPFGIEREYFLISYRNYQYNILASYSEEKSYLYLPNYKTITLPFFPLYKLKTKEKFIEKIKIFLLFS